MTTGELGICTGIIGFFSFLIGKLIERKKNQAEVAKVQAEAEGQELDNVDKAIKIWRELSVKLQQSVDELTREVHQLRKENASLKQEMKQLKRSIEHNK